MTTVVRHDTSRTAALLEDLRHGTAFRALLPMECLLGWPIAIRRRDPDRLYLQLLPHGQRRPARRGDPTALFAPLGVLTVAWPTGQVIGWTEAAFGQAWQRSAEPVAAFPHDAVRDLSVREYLACRDELLSLYDELFDAMATGSSFERIDRFAELLTTLLPPELVPYHRAQAPRFVERFFGPDPVR